MSEQDKKNEELAKVLPEVEGKLRAYFAGAPDRMEEVEKATEIVVVEDGKAVVPDTFKPEDAQALNEAIEEVLAHGGDLRKIYGEIKIPNGSLEDLGEVLGVFRGLRKKMLDEKVPVSPVMRSRIADIDSILDRGDQLDEIDYLRKEIRKTRPVGWQLLLHALREKQSAIELQREDRADIPDLHRQLEHLENPFNFSDVREQIRQAQRFLDKYSTMSGVPEDVLEAARAILKVDPEKISEVYMGDEEEKKERLADIREEMIKELKDRAHPNMNISESFKTFINTKARNFGVGKTHFPEKIQKELEREYSARAELWMVSYHWFPISKAMSSEKSSVKELSVNQIDNCPLLSAATYLWLGEKKTLDYKNDLTGETTSKDISGDVDKVLHMVYEGLKLPKNDKNRGNYNLWSINTKDAFEAAVATMQEESARLGENVTNKDAIALALQLAIAEHWGADQDFEFINHPAYPFIHPEEYMYFQGSNNNSVTGGKRIWVEAVRDLGGSFPDKDHNPFRGKFPAFAKIGYQAWKKNEGERLVQEGRYVRGFEEYWEKIAKEDALSIPQREVMVSISKGYAAWDALDQVGKVEGSKAVIDTLSTLRSTLDSAFFRFTSKPDDSLGDSSTIRMRLARQMTGKVLLEAARNMVWQISWDNPDIQEARVAPVDVLNQLVIDILADFKRSNVSTRVMYQEDTTAEQMRLEDGKGYGGLIGYGMDFEKSQSEAIKFIRWYYGDILSVTRRTIMAGLRPSFTEKEYAVKVSEERKKKDKTVLYDFSLEKLLSKSPIESGRIGQIIIGASDSRWWLA